MQPFSRTSPLASRLIGPHPRPRPLLFCLLFLLGAGLSAQVYEAGFGVELSPHFGNRRITGGQGLIFTEVERQDSLESGVPGYSVGLVYDSRAGKIGFTTGLRYIRTGYDVSEQRSGRPGSPRSFSQEVRASYLSLPIDLNFWQDVTEKDRVMFTFGLAASVHLNTRVRQTDFLDGMALETTDLPDDPDTDYRSPIVTLNTGLGLDHKFNDDWSLRFQPVFSFFLQGNITDATERTNRNYYQLAGRLTVRRIL